ncbi:MAG: cbb3-type cytochrome oxidase assembly protein CcoS [Bacteroidota bacterium]
MSALFFLVFLGLVVAGGFLLAFFWAMKSGQYQDSYTPSVRILFDDTSSTTDQDAHETTTA